MTISCFPSTTSPLRQILYPVAKKAFAIYTQLKKRHCLMGLIREEEERKQCTEAKNVAIACLTDLLKPEEQKCYFQLSLKIIQWLFSNS